MSEFANAVTRLAPPRRRRRFVVAALILAALSAYGWHWYTTPTLPEVDLAVAAPAVAAAIEEAEREVRQAPRSGKAWGELGLVLYANEFAEQAHTCFMQAERFDPTSPCWPYMQARRLLVDDPEAAVLVLRRAVARSEPADLKHGTAELVLAETLFEKGDRTEAAALCRQVLAATPGHLRAEFDLGLIALQDNPAQCIEHFTRCRGSPFAGKRAIAYLAMAYQRLGDTVRAAACVQDAAKLPADKLWPDIYVHQAMEHTAGALRHVLHADRLVGTPRTPEYLQALRDAAEESDDVLSDYRLGLALCGLEQYDAAEQVLRKALRKSPDSIGAHYLLGIALLQQGEQMEALGRPADAPEKFRAAADSLRRAIVLKPTHGQAHLFLGRCLQHGGQAGKALAEFRAAVECCPEVADAHLALGEALAAAGKRTDAIRHLEQAQSLASVNDPRPAAALARVRSTGTKTMAPSDK